jgi:hypothetical protein
MKRRITALLSRPTLVWFPLAALLNSFTMSGLLVILGVTGYPELAVSIGLVQGATLATFYVFSANARNLILADHAGLIASRLAQVRLVLLLPLAAVAYFLSATIGGVPSMLALTLILRRAAEFMGEVSLAQHEHLNQRGFAQRAVFVEAGSFILCLVLTIGFDFPLKVGAIPWALSPLLSVFGTRFSWKPRRPFDIHALSPHVGSTAIIGICVYVFRVSVTLLIAKATAGELFTAFAIGGIIPTIFGQVLAPTLMRRFDASVMRWWWVGVLPIGMLLASGAIVMVAVLEPEWLLGVGRSRTFWLATGLSVAGGGIMTMAALLRARIIHRDREAVFGPDFLANTLIVISIPLIYFSGGITWLAGLYLLSALLNLVCVWGATKRYAGKPYLHNILLLIAALLLVPIFFQLEGGLFRDPSLAFDTQAQLLRLPIPVSFLVLFTGIIVLGNYTVARRGLAVIFFSMLLFLASVFYLAGGHAAREGGKLVLLAQFLFPMFGLVLGEMFGAFTFGAIFERVALWVLLLVLPAQLVASWLSGSATAVPLVFVFSIYQYLEYFPAIAVALAVMAGIALWGRSPVTHPLIGILFPLVAIHAAASMSINAVIGGVTGMLVFVAFYWRDTKSRWQAAGIVAVAILVGALYAGLVAKVPIAGSDRAATTTETRAQIPDSPSFKSGWSVSASSTARMTEQWRFFASGIVSSPRAFLFGHASRPDRDTHPSAHNYWLDMAYNFGVLAILPLLGLLLVSARSLWGLGTKAWSDPLLIGAAFASVYLILFEGLVNVGMRQPYAGIITFFVFGLLITRIGLAQRSSPT